jgi:U3 small nucleolar RNA-associated protein 19
MPKRKSSKAGAKAAGGAKKAKKASKKTDKKAPSLSPLDQAILGTKHITPSSFNGVEGSSLLPSLIGLLLFPLEESELSEEHEKSIIRAVGILRKVFLKYSEQGDIPIVGSTGEIAAKGINETASRKKFKAYLKEQVKGFNSVLVEWLSLPKSQVQLQIVAFRALMDMVGRCKGFFDNDLFSRVTRAILTSPDMTVELALVYLQDFARKYGDVHYYALKNIATVATETLRQVDDALAGAGEDEEDEFTPLIVSKNAFNILSRIPMPISGDVLIDSMAGLKPSALEEDQDAEESSDESSDEDEDEREPAGKKAPWASPYSHKKMFSKAWLSLLRLPLSGVSYKGALKRMEKEIIPNLVNPLMLSDFLTKSCDRGGEPGLLALGGMHILIARYEFDYPSFYTKLFAILSPELFHAKYRAHFFNKLSLFMTSSALPVQTVASFAKRLARLALTGPPSGALYALPLIFNLLRRHPVCIAMIHRDKKAGGGGSGNGEGPVDPYRPNETNPMQTGALDSSLWEVEALQKHPNPSISTLAKAFNQKFNRKPYDLRNFSEANYDDLFEQAIERGRKKKNVALCFQEPSGLFEDSAFLKKAFSM